MNRQLTFGFGEQPPPALKPWGCQPKEYKVVALRECPTPDRLQLVDTPERAVAYWRLHVTTMPWFNPDAEVCVALLLTTRRRVKGHVLVSVGTLDTALAHSREVFRAAIVAAAAGVVLLHNHPSGDPTPSDADIRVARDLHRAGQLLKIDFLDAVIVGSPGRYSSLRELGHL